MNLRQSYQQQLANAQIVADPEQEAALALLDVCRQALIKRQSWWDRFMSCFQKKYPVKGLYMVGSVGVGKTKLMDMFYQSLPFDNKLRVHFHAFMAWAHEELKIQQGKKNPLKQLAKRLSSQTCVLCFDEFFVKDITNAMLLSGLLTALFNEGICLITTSNIPPEHLYEGGLQRMQFLPAIKLIQQHTQTFSFSSAHDYRQTQQSLANIFFTPIEEKTDTHMQTWFSKLTQGKTPTPKTIRIEQRDIAVLAQTDRIFWFDFQALCSIPRCQRDYLAIAALADVLLISAIPQIPAKRHDWIINFIALVDVCYDKKIPLILQSEVPVAELYPTGIARFDFLRTQSRLIEMQGTNFSDFHF